MFLGTEIRSKQLATLEGNPSTNQSPEGAWKKEGKRGQTLGTALENLKLCEAEQGTGQQGKREQGLELHTIIGPTLGRGMSPSFRKGFAWLRVRKSYL